MIKSQEQLAHAFDAIIKQQTKIDDVAGGILAAIKQARATTIEKFDSMVYAVYDAKGWNYQLGRPSADASIVKVPQIIRTYVSTVRAAYMLCLPVTQYESLYQLRQDLRSRRQQDRPTAAGGVGSGDFAGSLIEGIRITKSDEFNGQPVHDLAVVYIHLPDDERDLLDRSINRLVSRYTPTVESRLSAA